MPLIEINHVKAPPFGGQLTVISAVVARLTAPGSSRSSAERQEPGTRQETFQVSWATGSGGCLRAVPAR